MRDARHPGARRGEPELSRRSATPCRTTCGRRCGTSTATSRCCASRRRGQLFGKARTTSDHHQCQRGDGRPDRRPGEVSPRAGAEIGQQHCRPVGRDPGPGRHPRLGDGDQRPLHRLADSPPAAGRRRRVPAQAGAHQPHRQRDQVQPHARPGDDRDRLRRRRGWTRRCCSCATTASGSTCSTRTSCSASFSGCTGPRSSKAPASAWPPSGGSSAGTAAASGRKARSMRAPRSISRWSDAVSARPTRGKTTA